LGAAAASAVAAPNVLSSPRVVLTTARFLAAFVTDNTAGDAETGMQAARESASMKAQMPPLVAAEPERRAPWTPGRGPTIRRKALP
jgi:hypothetical protein